MARNPQAPRRGRRPVEILAVAIGLILLGLPLVQADTACGFAHADVNAPMEGSSLPDCECCGGANDGSTHLSTSCGMCAAAAAAVPLDLPQLCGLGYKLNSPALAGFTPLSGLDHPPTQ